MSTTLKAPRFAGRRKLAAIGIALFVYALTVPTTAIARVKLITLPVRERAEIQLDNPNATLVEEERIVPLVKGENQVDFSWANTQIDPNTIVFRVVGPAEQDKLEANIVSVSYPPNEASLVWTVGANASGSARVRISYLLGNLNKTFNYRAVASHDEKHLNLSQYMRLQNLANEEFRDTALFAGFGPTFHKPIGLNETKELLVEKFDAVPIRKTYSCNPQEFDYLDRAQNKLRVPMHYVIKNDAAHGLGKAALPYGKVRIFIEGAGGNAQSALAFLGEDWGKFTPKDDEMQLYLGVAKDVVVKRTIDKSELKRVTGNLFNNDVVIKYEIENFKKEPVTLDVAENLTFVRNEVRGNTNREVDYEVQGDTTFEAGPDREHSTSDKLIFHAHLPAGDNNGKAEKIVHKLHLTLKNEW
ncbi:MAG TPA: hypothetical protein VHU84_08545 [Lacipirellulaceae bacterium]|jgi:hypothetical protein|nr:hypothetical protein [Lacipirellulaceae bacterium]